MWRDLALKAIVANDQVVLDAIIKHCDKPPLDDGKPRFSESSVSNLFAVKGERLIQYCADMERSNVLLANFLATMPNRPPRTPDPEAANENRNMEGDLIEDEWYVEDEEIQTARSVLKKMLKYEYE